MARFLLPALASFALAVLFFALGGMKYKDYVSEVNYWQQHPCGIDGWCRVDTSPFLLNDALTYVIVGAALASAGLTMMMLNNRRKPSTVPETKTG